MQDMRSVPYEWLTTKCVRVIQVFISLAKYCYNATYLVTLKAHHYPIIFQILINHVNAIIAVKLCQIRQH